MRVIRLHFIIIIICPLSVPCLNTFKCSFFLRYFLSVADAFCPKGVLFYYLLISFLSFLV